MRAPGRARPAARAWGRPSAMGWLPVTTLVLSVLGLADSACQTYTHYSGAGLLGCSATGDPCVLVQHSAEASVFEIPVAVLGVAFGRICPYCTSVHIITFLLFSLLVVHAAVRGPAA